MKYIVILLGCMAITVVTTKAECTASGDPYWEDIGNPSATGWVRTLTRTVTMEDGLCPKTHTRREEYTDTQNQMETWQVKYQDYTSTCPTDNCGPKAIDSRDKKTWVTVSSVLNSTECVTEGDTQYA